MVVLNVLVIRFFILQFLLEDFFRGYCSVVLSKTDRISNISRDPSIVSFGFFSLSDSRKMVGVDIASTVSEQGSCDGPLY